MHSSRCSRSVCTQYGSLKLVLTHVILAGVTCGPTRITNRRRCSSKAHNSRLAMLFWPRRTAFLLDLTIKCLLWPGGRNVNEQYSNFCNTVHSGDKNGGRAHNAATMIKAHPQHWTSLAQPASIRSVIAVNWLRQGQGLNWRHVSVRHPSVDTHTVCTIRSGSWSTSGRIRCQVAAPFKAQQFLRLGEAAGGGAAGPSGGLRWSGQGAV